MTPPRSSWGTLPLQLHAGVAKAPRVPRLYVLAGTNGAGKSSIGGAMFRQERAEYFNPDEAALRILAAYPGLTQAQVNSTAWHEGKRLLELAITERRDFAFETTLGGKTITGLLLSALEAGIEVRLWYIGLNDPELHIARVQARVAKGGHSIPDDTIRSRYHRSLVNLIRLMPRLAELRVFDNSKEADPHTGVAPQPELLLHCASGRIVSTCDLTSVPEWVKPILAVAMKLSGMV